MGTARPAPAEAAMGGTVPPNEPGKDRAAAAAAAIMALLDAAGAGPGAAADDEDSASPSSRRERFTLDINSTTTSGYTS